MMYNGSGDGSDGGDECFFCGVFFIFSFFISSSSLLLLFFIDEDLRWVDPSPSFQSGDSDGGGCDGFFLHEEEL